jgi:endonuclease NucS-like protein
MKTVYDRPTKTLLAEWANEHLQPDHIFSKFDAVRWFKQHYPKTSPNTVTMHVEGMCINNARFRQSHPSIRPGRGYDLFYKVGTDQFRLWKPELDGPPSYKGDPVIAVVAAELDDANEAEQLAEFAYERDLQNFVAKNLHLVEPGLRLYENEEITGLETDAGGRRMDVLALDAQDSLVVIELKVSRGYDRVIGQLARYMAWVDMNMETSRPVRGIIIAKDITEDLKLAASRIPGVTLIEYEMELKFCPVAMAA